MIVNKYTQKYKSKKRVTVKCYGDEKVYNNREEAIKFYNECLMCSEGAERERYANVLSALMFSSEDYVTDGVE